jgi:hypothetical protein
MKRSKFLQKQIADAIRQVESRNPIANVCRQRDQKFVAIALPGQGTTEAAP